VGVVARFAYLSGWRKSEVQTLGWPDVDRAAGRIVLRREHSKNGEPRVLPLLGDLAALIERRWVAREYQTPDGTSALSPLVFHRDGQPVGDFRKAWETACAAAGVSGTLFHDLRRSAVRNMDRAGGASPSPWPSPGTRQRASTAATGSSPRTTSARRSHGPKRAWRPGRLGP
jgi:integrase